MSSKYEPLKGTQCIFENLSICLCSYKNNNLKISYSELAYRKTGIRDPDGTLEKPENWEPRPYKQNRHLFYYEGTARYVFLKIPELFKILSSG